MYKYERGKKREREKERKKKRIFQWSRRRAVAFHKEGDYEEKDKQT